MENEQNQKLVVPLWRKLLGIFVIVLSVVPGVLGVFDVAGRAPIFHVWRPYQAVALGCVDWLTIPFLISVGGFLIARQETRERYRSGLTRLSRFYRVVTIIVFFLSAYDLSFHGGDLVILWVIPLLCRFASWRLSKLQLGDVAIIRDNNDWRPHHSKFTPIVPPVGTGRPKSRVGFVLFAIFFGALGIHNFYALRIKSAVAQLLLTLFTGIALGGITGIAFAMKWEWWMANGWLVAAIVEPVVVLGVWLWGIVEICLVSRDGRGVPLQ